MGVILSHFQFLIIYNKKSYNGWLFIKWCAVILLQQHLQSQSSKLESDITTGHPVYSSVSTFVFSGTCIRDSAKRLVFLLTFFVCVGRKRASFLHDSYLDLKRSRKEALVAFRY